MNGATTRASHDGSAMTSGVAAIVGAPGHSFALERIELPELAEGQVLVRLEAVGICHADLGARSGEFPVSYPVVLGHEGCGVVVEAAPDVSSISAGQRVVLTFDTCGGCRSCRAGKPARCSRQFARNWTGDEATPRAAAPTGDVQLGFFGQSSFAEYAIAGVRNAIVVDVTTGAELLAPLGCGVQTGFGAVSNVLKPGPDDVVAVFGAGAVGLSAVMALGLQEGVTTVVVEPDAGRRELATELGAGVLVDPGVDDPIQAIRAHFPDGLHGAVECSGHTSAFAAAVSSTGPSGTIVVVGSPPFGARAELDVFDLILGSKTIVGCIEGDCVPREEIPRLAKLIERGDLRVDRMIDTYPFAEIEQAASDMTAGRVVKPVLTF
jgi:aryl-alcohol dehydrogenase